MVSARSHRVSRVPWYSGSCQVSSDFGYEALTLSGRLVQSRSPVITESLLQSEPRDARITVWALPRSLAATYGITCCFLFLRLLRCFSSPGSLPQLMDCLLYTAKLLLRKCKQNQKRQYDQCTSCQDQGPFCSISTAFYKEFSQSL